MKENGLKNEHELQSYFIQRMEKYLNSKGKTLIGWDEILEGGLAPKAVVMSWRGEEGGIAAAKQKHDVIMTPGNPVYFDHTQSENEDSVTIGGYNPIEKVYAYEPVPKELNAEEAKYVLGAQANMWTEYMENTRKVEYMAFPRMAALSEVLWSIKEKKDWNDFEKRLMVQFKRYDRWKVNYSRAYFDLKTIVLPTSDYSGITWSIANKFNRPSTDIFEKIYSAIPMRDTVAVYDEKDISKIKGYRIDTSRTRLRLIKSNLSENPIDIVVDHPGTFVVKSINLIPIPGSYHFGAEQGSERLIEQRFILNKVTGKKISLAGPPSAKYPGDGAFTLINGIQNEKGLARSKEFLGFEGTDCEATIDLVKETEIKEVIIHTFEQQGSWIYFPKGMDISVSSDGQNFTSISNRSFPGNVTDKTKNATLDTPVKTRYLKLLIRNFGDIPDNLPGAGHKAWLFVDEIEVN